MTIPEPLLNFLAFLLIIGTGGVPMAFYFGIRKGIRMAEKKYMDKFLD